jgi:hypothetical protein
MIIHHDADSIMARIGKAFTMKKGSVGDPDLYLGARIKPMVLDNGIVAWSMSASKYVQEAYKNCKDFIEKNDNFKGKYKVTAKPANPFPTTFDADLDVSDPLMPEEASYFQSIIGVLRWMIEIGRVDINIKVSILSSYQAYPREGHLHAAIHLMSSSAISTTRVWPSILPTPPFTSMISSRANGMNFMATSPNLCQPTCPSHLAWKSMSARLSIVTTPGINARVACVRDTLFT